MDQAKCKKGKKVVTVQEMYMKVMVIIRSKDENSRGDDNKGCK